MSNSDQPSHNRRIRVFISSTFRDMIEERDELMSQTWPQLRKLCQERHVELVEVDLRWGIAEEQSTRKETLKLCLDEIRACRPFFIGLLGERYGWTPGDDAFTADLKEEQPWLKNLHGKSVTEMEILHGVLNEPDMAGRAFFYFRDPAYVKGRGPDFLSETPTDAGKQTSLKTAIRTACAAKKIPLRENYPDPKQLAAMVLADLSAAIEEQYPKENIPDPLTREAQHHEAFAEIRRRTYIGRANYFQALDRHAAGSGGPLILLGDSGSGKSALLANWVERWRKAHPNDFVFQHYIGGTPDSADHWRLMTRLIAEIKRWADDPEELPKSHDDMLRDFPVWLAKARIRAERQGVRLIIILDALNQLKEADHARLLGWLPVDPFTGPLRLIVSTLPGKAGTDDPLEAVRKRGWQELRVQPLTVEERKQMIANYLPRFGKKLDDHRLNRLASATPSANPFYLKILLDDLRVTGTHDRLDERLKEYLKAIDIPALLQQVLARWQRDYERDRPGLVSETLGLIYAARRGLSETELLQLLGSRPQSQIGNRDEVELGTANAGQRSGNPQSEITHLPPALWSPLRAALEDSLVDCGGILNFAHDFLRMTVESAFVPDEDKKNDFQLQLADYFEAQPITVRTCDELPWLLKETDSRVRLRACLLDIDRFLFIQKRDENELLRYWVCLQEERTMEAPYVQAFQQWAWDKGKTTEVAVAANELANFLSFHAALHTDTESLYRCALTIDEQCYGKNHSVVAIDLSNLAQLLKATNRLAEAEPLMRRALKISEQCHGETHPAVAVALNNLAVLLKGTNRFADAEPLYRRALKISEQRYGENHPNVAISRNNLAQLLEITNRFADAEALMARSLQISEQNFGADHPDVAIRLNNLAELYRGTNRLADAEPLMRRALRISEQSYGENHPNVAINLKNLALLLKDTNRLADAEPLMRRALRISEQSYGENHPNVAINLASLASVIQASTRFAEAEPLLRRALEITEQSYGSEHPDVGTVLNNLALLLRATNRLPEAETPMRRALAIAEKSFGPEHSSVASALNNLAQLLQATNRQEESEPLMWRALTIDEQSFGKDHPNIAIRLNNLAGLLQTTSRLAEAEPLMRRVVEILLKFTRTNGYPHPHLQTSVNSYGCLLMAMGLSKAQAFATVDSLMARYGLKPR